VVEPGRARDGGFTLLETIVVVLLVSVLASVMVAVVAVILRNAPATEARTDDSRSYQRLLTWLPRDAASTEPGRFVFGSGSPVCIGADTAGSQSLVQLKWSPPDGSGKTYVVDYRAIPLAPTRSQVTRYTCVRDAGTQIGGTTALDVTKDVFLAEAMPAPVVTPTIGVEMRLTTCGDTECTVAGPVISIHAGSHNPSDDLP
jgi:prepilin-type N-terminal cleavage/methylation domain-containing protein